MHPCKLAASTGSTSCSSGPCEPTKRFTVSMSNLQPRSVVPWTSQELLTPLLLLQVTGDRVNQIGDPLLLKKPTLQTSCIIRNLSQVMKEQTDMFQETFRALPGLSCFCLVLQQVLVKLSHPSKSMNPTQRNRESHLDVDKAGRTKAETSLRSGGPWALVENRGGSRREMGLFFSLGKGRAAVCVEGQQNPRERVQSGTPASLGSYRLDGSYRLSHLFPWV